MAISLPDARQLSDEVLQALRLRALRGIEQGFTETEVAELLGVAHETVCRWWTAYAAEGLDALPGPRSGRPLGSGRFLSDAQARHIQGLLERLSPEELGIAAPLWTRRAVRDLIQNVGNGQKAHHYFGRSRNRPKPAGFGEMARAYWTTGGSAVR
jgi:transposase